jgi:hypothetical protein
MLKLSRTTMWILGGSFLAAAGLISFEMWKKHHASAAAAPKAAGEDPTQLTMAEKNAVAIALTHETNKASLESFADSMKDSPKTSEVLAAKAASLPPEPAKPLGAVGGFNLFKTIHGIVSIPGSVMHEVEKIKPFGDFMHALGKVTKALSTELNKNPFGKLLMNVWTTVQVNGLTAVFGPFALLAAAVPGMLRGEKFDKAFLGWAKWYTQAASNVVPGLGPEIMKQAGSAMQSLAPQIETMVSQINPKNIMDGLKSAGLNLDQVGKTIDAIKSTGLNKIGDLDKFAKQVGVPTDLVDKVEKKIREETIGKLDPKILAKQLKIREDAAQHAIDGLLRKGSSFAMDGAPATVSHGIKIPAVPANPGKHFDLKTGNEIPPGGGGAPIPPPPLAERKVDAVKVLVHAAQSGDPVAQIHVDTIDRLNARRKWVEHYNTGH